MEMPEDAPAAEKSFKWLIVGLVCILIDVPSDILLLGVYLTPDFLGYIFIAIGLGGLLGFGTRVVHARWAGFVLIVLFWGLVAILTDIPIDIPLLGVYLPPDFLGYIFIAIGLGGLLGFGPRVEHARWAGFVLIVLSLLELPAAKHVNYSVYSAGGTLVGAPKFYPWTLINELLLIFIIWQITTVLYERAMERADEQFAATTIERRNLYLGFVFVKLMGLCLTLLFPSAWYLFVGIVFIFGLVVLWMLIQLLNQSPKLAVEQTQND